MANDNLIHVLRHGQFTRDRDSYDGPLTPIGRRQARRTATRLDEYRIARLYSSDVQRARETAEIIARKLSGLSVNAIPMLREMTPTRLPGRRVPLDARRQAQQRIEHLIKRFFTKAPAAADTVLVCHGNLIRALFCRLLGVRITKWPEFGISHCGVTSFSFGASGQVLLQCFNDTGHLPVGLRTSI